MHTTQADDKRISKGNEGRMAAAANEKVVFWSMSKAELRQWVEWAAAPGLKRRIGRRVGRGRRSER